MNKLEARDLVVRYGQLTAVDGVSFGIPAGGALGLVGESGSGKSTIARAIVQLARVSRGQILLDGEDITYAHGANLNEIRSKIQMIFQDPYSSLNPRLSVGAMIDEVLQRHRNLNAAQRRLEVGRLLEMVALDPLFAGRYPHQFSGGQRQRIAIARTLAAQPELVILDEVVSALDVSVQAEILNLLRRPAARISAVISLYLSRSLRGALHERLGLRHVPGTDCRMERNRGTVQTA